ncbi:hypothetical protein FXO38_21903 [Capsicum annuum]|nr:hypothetical protein FXO38_21903 [Capsicum annuum]
MEWLVFVLQEASKDSGTHMRWKLNEQYYNFFCSRKTNKFGRVISIVTVQGRNGSIIIIPELTLNAGWGDVAFNIDNFIKEQNCAFISYSCKKADPKIPYEDSVGTRKWQSKEASKSLVRNKTTLSPVSGGDANQENGLLRRCIVGNLSRDEEEKPTLTDIRK